MNKKRVTLILPCYNEAEHFEQSCELIISRLKNTPWLWEIIFIDDRSSDDTRERIRRLVQKKTDVKMRAFFHQQNVGRGGTVTEGIRLARTEIVGYMDIDCEIAPHYLSLFVEKILAGDDLAAAWRIYNLDPSSIMRFAASKAYVSIEQHLLKNNFPDTEAGMKFFRKGAIFPILNEITSRHWFWDTEVIVRGNKANLEISFIPVVFMRRSDKTSTVRLLPDTLDYLRSLWSLRQELGI